MPTDRPTDEERTNERTIGLLVAFYSPSFLPACLPSATDYRINGYCLLSAAVESKTNGRFLWSRCGGELRLCVAADKRNGWMCMRRTIVTETLHKSKTCRMDFSLW